MKSDIEGKRKDFAITLQDSMKGRAL